jgi:uncharacterized membrane protein
MSKEPTLRDDLPMLPLVWLSLIASVVLLALLPLLFAELLGVSLTKLHLSGGASLLLAVAVILGGFINIPIARIRRSETLTDRPLTVYGLPELWPRLRRVRQETIIAVNLGGCVIPVGLAAYELLYVGTLDPRLLGAIIVASLLNIIACSVLARPVAGVGIALPFFAPALVAAVAALFLAPEQAPPVAFIAGILGPLVGADLFHLKDIQRIGSGVASIGGAGTFDGIVLSGIIAAYLA